jgi:hypothetical protein
MSTKTPKQILAEMLTGKDQPNHAQELHEILISQIKSSGSRRKREVIRYILDASEGRLAQNKKCGGSLKFVLWFMNDHLGDEVFEYYARILLRSAIDHPDWDLGFILPHLENLVEFRPFFDEMQQPIDKDEKVKDLILMDIAGWKAAVNFSPNNLNKIGFDAGAQVVISSSHKGVMIMSERGLEIEGLDASKGWSQRYPNFWYCQKRGDGEDAWRLISQLDEILVSVDGHSHKTEVLITDADFPKELVILRVQDRVVALNLTQKNLTRQAFRLGADLVLASSNKGTMVNAGKDWVVHGLNRETWEQVHANLWVKKFRGSRNDFWEILSRLDELLIPVDRFIQDAPIFV